MHLITTLSSLSVFQQLGILLASYTIGWLVYTHWFHPLAKYQGPYLASITRLWFVLEVFGGELDKTELSLHEKYGKFVRIAPDEISCSDPSALKIIYGLKSGFTKTDFYLPWRAPYAQYPDIFTETNEQQHTQRRKIVNGLYSMTSILTAEPRTDDCVNLFLLQMDTMSSNKKNINLGYWLQMYALDAIGNLFFGSPFGFLETGRDLENYMCSLDTWQPLYTAASVMPIYIRSLFLGVSMLLPSPRKAIKASAYMDNAAVAYVTEREKAMENKDFRAKDIPGGLFRILEEKGEALDFNVADVIVEARGALLAGSDTTGAALSSIMYYLLKTPASYQTLLKEIDTADRNGSLTSPIVQYNEAVRLLYLLAVCKEAMRMHPSIGFALPRHVPPSGCQIGGEWFKGGTRIGINAAVVHRDKTISGEDADVFNPDRWLRDSAAEMDKYMFHFGMGSRNCIGKNIYKLVPTLLRSYHLELVDPQKEWVTKTYIISKPTEVNVRVFKR